MACRAGGGGGVLNLTGRPGTQGSAVGGAVVGPDEVGGRRGLVRNLNLPRVGVPGPDGLRPNVDSGFDAKDTSDLAVGQPGSAGSVPLDPLLDRLTERGLCRLPWGPR